jgi:hypothetical protein
MDVKFYGLVAVIFVIALGVGLVAVNNQIHFSDDEYLWCADKDFDNYDCVRFSKYKTIEEVQASNLPAAVIAMFFGTLAAFIVMLVPTAIVFGKIKFSEEEAK